MRSFVLPLICALVAAPYCSSAALKTEVKRQVNLQSAETTTPCSLSVYRYLYNLPGVKIRPNLPAGTVIFGKPLPPAGPTDFRDFDSAGSNQQPLVTRRPDFSYPTPRPVPSYPKPESGSKIDAPEPIKPEGSASGPEPNFSYLPPGNNYLPPPQNSLPPFQKKPNYFIPLGSVTIGSSTPAPEEGSIISSTPLPDLSSTIAPSEIPISTTIQPEIPVSTIGPQYTGFISSTPAPTPSPALPVLPPVQGPAFPLYPAASNPELNIFSPQPYPLAPGQKCECEEGKTHNYQLPVSNQLEYKPPVIISSTPRPGPVVYENSGSELSPSAINENSIEFSFSNPSTPAPPAFFSTPVPDISPNVFFSSTPQPEIKFGSSTPLPSLPPVQFLGFDYSQSFLPSGPNFAPAIQPQQPINYKPLPRIPPPSPVLPVNPYPTYPQPSTSAPFIPSPAPGYPYPQPSPPAPQPTLPQTAPDSGYQYPKPSNPQPLPSETDSVGYSYPKPNKSFSY